MKDTKRADKIVLIEKLRLVESEIFRLSAKNGIKTIEQLDTLVASGKLTEKLLGDDLFTLDHLLSEKEKIEKELEKLNIRRGEQWKSLQDLLELQKLSSKI